MRDLVHEPNLLYLIVNIWLSVVASLILVVTLPCIAFTLSVAWCALLCIVTTARGQSLGGGAKVLAFIVLHCPLQPHIQIAIFHILDADHGVSHVMGVTATDEIAIVDDYEAHEGRKDLLLLLKNKTNKK